MSDRKFRTLLPNTDRRPQSRERNEELRVVCGTRGDPGTVAPFRAWRGSRDLVAQSPKFHAPALAQISRECREKSSTASPGQPECGLGFIQFLSDFLPLPNLAQIRISVLLPEHPAAAPRMGSPNLP